MVFRILNFSKVPISLTIFMVFSILVFVVLGAWQLERLEEKRFLSQQLKYQLNVSPVNIKTILNDSRSLKEYWSWRAVRLVGTWDLKNSIILESRTYQGKSGINVVTPFHLDLNLTVLINRGWFAQELKEVIQNNIPKGPIALTGILRIKEQRGSFAPANCIKKGQWYILDISEITKCLGFIVTAPFFIIALKKIGDSKPILICYNLANNHLSYAITWFVLAIVVLLMYFVYLRQYNFNH